MSRVREISKPSWADVEVYHAATRHRPGRFARSPATLDMANRPAPFRRFTGAPFIPFAALEGDQTPEYDQLFRANAEASPPPVVPRAVDRKSLGTFFAYSLAITARVAHGGEVIALRANPSAGNLHPVEGYLVSDRIGDVEENKQQPGVYHYAAEEHGLEQRTTFASGQWKTLTGGFPNGAFLVGLATIHWRSAWKYGERAYRYCQLDLGHAIGSMRIAAAALGWQMHLLDGMADDAVARLLGLDRTDAFPLEEREVPAMLAVVAPLPSSSVSAADDFEATLPTTLPRSAVDAVGCGAWHGKANRLSRVSARWDAIAEVSTACTKQVTHRSLVARPRPVECPPPPRSKRRSAAVIIRQRRSTHTMRTVASLPRATFYAMLARLIPSPEAIPFDAIAWPPTIGLGLFVHRVEGLAPGLYALPRGSVMDEEMRDAMASDYAWQQPDGCPQRLELALLRAGDVRTLASDLCCGQAIAGDGVFSVMLLADWQTAAARDEPWAYRQMHWEAGMVGQLLHLEAEAAGLRGTAIGCFFDNASREACGLVAGVYEPLMHFAIGLA